MNLKDKYDVIIIGAGLGGLTAGLYLIKEGFSVLIIEQHYQPGGYATNFDRNGFTFDSSLHLLDGCNSDGVLGRIVDELGISDKISFIRLKPSFKQIFPDTTFTINHDYNQFREDIFRAFPDEKNGFISLEKIMHDIFDEARNYYENPFQFKDIFSMMKKLETLTKYNKTTVEELATSFIKNRQLIEIISQLWFFYGLPADQLSCVYFSFPWITFINKGCYYLEGGGGRLSEVLANEIERLGGGILLKTKVTKIDVENKKVKGIRIGNDFISSEMVISNIDPKTIFNELINKEFIANPIIKKVNRMKESISAFQVYLGLNKKLEKMNITDHEIIIQEQYTSHDAFDMIMKRNYKEAPFAIGIYDNKDKGFAPPGKSVVNIFMPMSYDSWNCHEEAYNSQKQKITELLIKRAEKYIPGLTEMIEVQEAGTPHTMQRYTLNSRGAIHGFSQTVNQTGTSRLNIKSPVQNLFFTGAWTRPGGGFSTVMISGRLCSKILLKSNT